MVDGIKITTPCPGLLSGWELSFHSETMKHTTGHFTKYNYDYGYDYYSDTLREICTQGKRFL